jgi:hypothetical protein
MPTLELLGEHPGGLIDLGAVLGQIRGLAAWTAAVPGVARHLVLSIERQQGRGIGEDQRITQLERAERAGLLPVHAHHPGPDRPDLQREREDRRGSG